tara:strand:+ start:439 stop:2049 length:1611 start_codon:yes stop_codon:yes gene_type:complete
MFTTVQFDSLSTELKQRMCSTSLLSQREWPQLYRELSESINEDDFQFVHIEANTPIYITKDNHSKPIDFVPVYVKNDTSSKNNKPIILVHLDFDSINHVFDSLEDAQRILDKWSKYVYLNLSQFHPTVAKIEFQIANHLQVETNPIKLYNQKNRKGRAGVSVEYAPTVLIDTSSIADINSIEEAATAPDFVFKFIQHDETFNEDIYEKIATKINNGMLIIHPKRPDILNQILRVAEVMSIRYMITDDKNESLVQSFLHHGFSTSSITEQQRTGCIISRDNELEITSTSQRISFKSLTEGWALRRPQTKFFDSLENFYTIINECKYISGDELRNSFETWRKRYRNFCWRLIDEEEKGPDGKYKSVRSINPSKEMTIKILYLIRDCEDLSFLSSLVTKFLKLEDTTERLLVVSGQEIFTKQQVLSYSNAIGSLLSDVFRRNHRAPSGQTIFSKYNLSKPPGIYTGLSNLHHPNPDADLHDLEQRGIDFTLVQRLAVYKCIRNFLENLKSVMFSSEETVSLGLKEFFSIEKHRDQEEEE